MVAQTGISERRACRLVGVHRWTYRYRGRRRDARVVTTTGGLVCDVADDAEVERLFRRILDGSMLPSPDATEIAKYDFRQVARQFAAHVELLDSVKSEG